MSHCSRLSIVEDVPELLNTGKGASIRENSGQKGVGVYILREAVGVYHCTTTTRYTSEVGEPFNQQLS